MHFEIRKLFSSLRLSFINHGCDQSSVVLQNKKSLILIFMEILYFLFFFGGFHGGEILSLSVCVAYE